VRHVSKDKALLALVMHLGYLRLVILISFAAGRRWSFLGRFATAPTRYRPGFSLVYVLTKQPKQHGRMSCDRRNFCTWPRAAGRALGVT